MKEVFILGAGFSKAISAEMPLTMDLGKVVLNRCQGFVEIDDHVRAMIEDDFEKALTFLSQEKPWLPEAENLRHKALYLDITNVIRVFFVRQGLRSTVLGTEKPPSWLEALIAYWHEHRCHVITLNYDTLIERVASGNGYSHGRTQSIPTDSLYPIKLSIAGQRNAMVLSADHVETFHLYKLHGSTNWFYSGRTAFFGEQLFYIPCIGGVETLFAETKSKKIEEFHRQNVRDKVPLIMPPALDKSAFFQHESLRSLWHQASAAINQADRFVCMGYSLPTADLTMAQFLKSSAPFAQKPFEIVNPDPTMAQHFSGVLGQDTFTFSQTESNHDCIPRFVVDHCIPNAEDKAEVIRTTLWNQHC